MTYRILTYGEDALRRRARPVGEVDDGIREAARDMLATMYAAEGVGLAAEQVGRDEAMFVVDVPAAPGPNGEPPENPDVPMPLVMINPEITASSGEQSSPEGCLSFPELYVQITRAMEVEAVYTDLENRRRTVRARGLLARAIQHELDHLRGVLLVDRMSAVQKVAHAGRLKRIRKQRAG
ncbi:MAG: peptide deformylase [Lentisphaerae bacterium]|nr:peptide deformylase [Lentisphaerota bacterium]